MKYNYPVKYCVMPVEANDWFGNKIEIKAFIVSKCYVINKIVNYNVDGSEDVKYNIVFPYQKVAYTNYDYERVYPQFDRLENLNNGVTTRYIFENREEAKAYANELNKKYNEENYNSTFMYQDNKENSYNKDLEKFQLLEDKIELLTSDMIVNNGFKKNEVIFCEKENNKVLEMSLYDFIIYYRSMNFYVCSVDIETMNEIKLNIDNKKWFKKLNDDKFKPLLYSNSGIIKIASNSSDGSYYLDQNDKLNYSKKIPSFVNDARFMRNDDMLKIYSTETIDDIINSYINKEAILEERDLVKKLKYN